MNAFALSVVVNSGAWEFGHVLHDGETPGWTTPGFQSFTMDHSVLRNLFST